MKIAVSMGVVERGAHAEPCDAISHDWERLLGSLNVDAVLVPNQLADPAGFCREQGVGGLLLTGGNDIAPQPGEAWPGSPSVSAARDRTEQALLADAVERRLPVVGVCRGMQLLNVWFGGRLVRDVSAASGGEPHVGVEHRLTIVDEAYERRLGAKQFSANSFHHHGVTAETLAPSLRPMAVTPGGIVEAVSHPDLPVVGMQWHPERPGPDAQISSALLALWLRWCADGCWAARGA